jgi:hypothetical protein
MNMGVAGTSASSGFNADLMGTLGNKGMGMTLDHEEYSGKSTAMSNTTSSRIGSSGDGTASTKGRNP